MAWDGRDRNGADLNATGIWSRPTAQAPLSTDFWRFWTASTLSNLGDGLRLVALPLLATTLTRSPLLIAGVSAFTFLPWVTVGPVSGVVVDRVDRRRLIVAVQLVRGLAAGGFAVAVATGSVTIAAVYVIAVVIGIGETLADTAAQAAIPRLVGDPDRLELANSRLLAGQIVMNQAVGTAAGGVLFAAAAVLPFSIDAATYLIAAGLILTVREDLGPGPGAPARQTVRQDLVEGIRWLWRHDILRPYALSVALTNLGLQVSTAILVLFVLDVLLLPEAAFGLLLAVGAVGGVVGASVGTRIVGRFGRTRTLITTTAVTAASTGVIGASSHSFVAAASLFVGIASVTVFNVVGQSMRQAVTPSRLLGRVVSAYRFVGFSSMPAGAALGGVIAELFGLRTPFFVGAALIAVAAVIEARVFTDDAISAAIAGNADFTADEA